MARDIATLAFVQGKGWVPPEATPEQEAALVAAYEAAAAELKDCKDSDERPRLKKALREAHVRCAQECMVEIGRGSIRSVDEGDRNSRVEIGADHLNDPIHGYIDMTDFTLWAQVATIRANFGRCRYRIVVRRQAEVHPSIAWTKFTEAQQKKRIRDLVMLAPETADVAAPAAPPAPAAQAPVAPPAPAAQAAPAVASAPAPVATTTLFPQPAGGTIVCPLCGHPTTGPVFKHSSGRFAHKTCPTTAPDPDPAPAAEPVPADTGDDGPPPDLGRHPRVEENKPWQRTNTDGSINLGSFAIQASLSMVELAVELLSTHLADVGEPGPPAPASVSALAGLLLAAADRTQQIVRADHHFDRSDNSHTRARGAVRIALKLFPVPFREADESPADLGHRREVWVTSLVDYASMLIQAAVTLDR